MNDQHLTTTKRVVCPHGAVMELRIESVMTDAGITTRVTEALCSICLRELAAKAVVLFDHEQITQEKGK